MTIKIIKITKKKRRLNLKNKMELKGTIKVIGQTETSGSSGFTKRQVVVETTEQYPQLISIYFVKEKCSVLDAYNVGNKVTVGINLRGNEYNGKYYVNIQGWKISNDEATTPNAPVTSPEDEEDDLPY